MAQATWAQRPLCGSSWALEYPYCHQMITQTHPKGEGFPEKTNFRKFSDATNRQNNSNFGYLLSIGLCTEVDGRKERANSKFGAFWGEGGHGSGYMGRGHYVGPHGR